VKRGVVGENATSKENTPLWATGIPGGVPKERRYDVARRKKCCPARKDVDPPEEGSQDSSQALGPSSIGSTIRQTEGLRLEKKRLDRFRSS